MENKRKLAIIMSGGGMRSSFGVGVILAITEKYKYSEPFLVICGSGSAGTGAYFVARQYNAIRDIWTRLIVTRKFINPWRFWKIIDINYLVDIILKKQSPLDTNALRKSKITLLISALNKNTGGIDYFDNHSEVDIFECIRAATAMPLAFRINPSVKIGSYDYCDNPTSSTGAMHIKKAIEMGATDILIINNSTHKKILSKSYFFSFWMFFQKCKVHYYKNESELARYKIPDGINILTINPRTKLKVTRLNNRKELLEEALLQGYKETISNTEIERFLA